MADFSVNATQLSGPQGQGATPVRPVTASPFPLQAIESVGNIFLKGLEVNRKEELLAQETAVTSAYAKKQQLINEAIASGQLKPAEGSARSRALYSETIAGNPQYAESLNKIAAGFKGYSEMGTAEEEAKTQKDLFNTRIKSAQAAGFQIDTDLPKEVQEQQLRSFEKIEYAQREFKQTAERNAEARATTKYDQEQTDRQDKENATGLLATVGRENYDAFTAAITSIVASAGTSEQRQEAERRIQEKLSVIKRTTLAVSGKFPELARGYDQLFESSAALALKQLDPKNKAEDLKNEWEALKLRAMLLGNTRDPGLAGTAAAYNMFPNDPNIMSKASPTVLSYLSSLSDTRAPTMPIIGNPAVEKPALEYLQSTLKNAGVFDKNSPEFTQRQTSVNKLLEQAAPRIQTMTPEQMSPFAKFFASREYGEWAAQGNVSPLAAETIKRTYQSNYTPVVVDSITNLLERTYKEPAQYTGRGGTQPKKKAGEEIQFIDMIDIKATSAGVTFSPKPGERVLTPGEQSMLSSLQMDLKKAEVGLNTVIRIGAHAEQTTDYQKYWEDNKHIIMPQYYQTPGLSVGTKKPGKDGGTYEYIGGPELRKSSWRKVE